MPVNHCIRNLLLFRGTPLLLGSLLAGAPWAEAAEPRPGLLISYAVPGEEAADTQVIPSVRLHVSEGESPSPFLPAGPFEARWRGFVDVDLRTDFFFQVEARGTFRMAVNGRMVLRFEGEGGKSELTHPVRLGKGTNSIEAYFRSPPRGDAMVRLHWGELENMLYPLAPAALRHLPEGEAYERGRLRHLGRQTALERRCFHCHPAEVPDPIPELALDAPAFTGIGRRREVAWLADWILDPQALRPGARMPKMVHGPNARKDAEAMALYLSLQRNGGEVDWSTQSEAVAAHANLPESTALILHVDPDAPLYEKLHCAACHTKPGADKDLPGMVPLRHIGRKFAGAGLVEFLRKPEAHYEWTRMPNFHLSAREAEELAAYLLDQVEVREAPPLPADPAMIQRGRELVQTRGCLNCHEAELENRFRARPFVELQDLERGCLAEEEGRDPNSDTPRFDLTAEERRAVREFARGGLDSLGRHVPADFARRHLETLQCARCHGEYDGFPELDKLGGKLKADWTHAFIAGEIPYKPRPWLPARMPAFKAYAEGLALGMAARHGVPPEPPPEPPLDPERAEVGRRLVGKVGGFSCVSCHAVAEQKATEVFEVEGINLQYAVDRLRKSYYTLWLLNPILVDPQTKMPMYFDGGLSPLTEVLDGQAQPQIDAMWEYFRLREKMPRPNLGEF